MMLDLLYESFGSKTSGCVDMYIDIHYLQMTSKTKKARLMI